jgi:hypothetical protein
MRFRLLPGVIWYRFSSLFKKISKKDSLFLLGAFSIILDSGNAWSARLVPIRSTTICSRLLTGAPSETFLDLTREPLAWMKSDQQVTATVRRTIFRDDVKAAIQKRLTLQFDQKVDELVRRIKEAEAVRHSSIYTDLTSKQAEQNAATLKQELDTQKGIFLNTLQSQVEAELTKNCYEIEQAKFASKVGFFEVSGKISKASLLKVKVYDYENKRWLMPPISFIETILLDLDDGRSALIDPANVINIRPTIDF